MKKKIILAILLFGVIYRLFLTSGGNFLFNMDNARDFVDIREMVELGKFRLTGPTSAIEGLYNGPLWYYFLSTAYIITHGDPYGAIVGEIILWAIGGFFLLKLVSEFNEWLIVPIGLVWIASNYIVLTNLYSFNPNPVPLLTPVFIYSLAKYLKEKKTFGIISSFLLAGAFFNFEMNAGVFCAPIILISIFLIDRKSFKDKYFWIGFLIFIATLLPQILFDLKHQFIMSKSVLRFLSESNGNGWNPLKQIPIIWESFFNVFQATMFNQKILSWAILILLISVFKAFSKNIAVSISLLSIIVPFIGYLILPVAVNPWHLGAEAAASLIIIAFILKSLWKPIAIILSLFLIFYSLSNIFNFFANDFGKPSSDPSLFKNEIATIDYVYKKANGKNFKVYTYLPSVYDYPYQYLFWWYGKKTYGYVPGEYKYLPNKPEYIASGEKFQGSKDNLSNLVFLIKEPDRNYTRAGWEGNFINLKSLEKQMVGPIEVEIRRETKNGF